MEKKQNNFEAIYDCVCFAYVHVHLLEQSDGIYA